MSEIIEKEILIKSIKRSIKRLEQEAKDLFTPDLYDAHHSPIEIVNERRKKFFEGEGGKRLSKIRKEEVPALEKRIKEIEDEIFLIAMRR